MELCFRKGSLASPEGKGREGKGDGLNWHLDAFYESLQLSACAAEPAVCLVLLLYWSLDESLDVSLPRHGFAPARMAAFLSHMPGALHAAIQ